MHQFYILVEPVADPDGAYVAPAAYDAEDNYELDIEPEIEPDIEPEITLDIDNPRTVEIVEDDDGDEDDGADWDDDEDDDPPKDWTSVYRLFVLWWEWLPRLRLAGCCCRRIGRN